MLEKGLIILIKKNLIGANTIEYVDIYENILLCNMELN